PAYMAPEQWTGGTVDAKSDQFAFCVALFEAIASVRPFDGVDEAALREALRGPPRAAWPRNAPRWLWRALVKGLAHDPAARWPDMRALLRVVDPTRRQRRAIAVGMAGLTAVLAATAIGAARDPCADAGQPIARLWGEPQRDAVLDAARRTDPSWGEQSGAHVVAQLDALAASWTNAARASCAAPASSHGRGCLQWTQARFAAAIDDVQRGDPALLVGAVARAELLPDPSVCVDAPALAAFSERPPDDARIAAQLDEAERQLGALTVRGDPSVYRDAAALARSAADAAIAGAETEVHEPLLARALLVAGRIELGEGEHARAESRLRRALAMARRSNDARIAAAASADLVYAVSRDRDRLREAEDLATEATAMIAALGDPPLLRARLLAHRASAIARGDGGEHESAVALHEEVAMALRRELGDHHPATIVELGNIGAALGSAGRHDDARHALEEALAAADVVWGEQHPRTAALLGSLGLARMRGGDLDGAERDLRRSLALREAVLGSEHAQVDDARYNLALLLRRRGAHAEAVTLLHDGLAHVRARRGEDDALLGPWWVAEGESLLELGAHERARFAFAAALRLFERTGASARDYARVRFAAARAWQDADADRARLLAEQARVDATDAKADTLVAEIDAWLATPLR
ncbi:MAG TPA: tetratricopeptide repeat-containing protein kinase family protein, partial [Nannocystaceae bacterium]|nr:tetratricopeptide repeat-containing protein kinase family protein [Nannocystaceae bacterium]